MATTVQKITLSSSRDIPFNKLVLSQSTVRRVKAGVSIEELAEDIARRTLLQSLSVRPVLDADGAETGCSRFGRRPRFKGLQLHVKQKRLAKSGPCVPLAGWNIQRAALHQFRQVVRGCRARCARKGNSPLLWSCGQHKMEKLMGSLPGVKCRLVGRYRHHNRHQRNLRR